MQAFIEEQIGAAFEIFPRGELARFYAEAEAFIMEYRLFLTVDVVALFATAVFTIGLEQGFQSAEVVCIGAEMTEVVVSLSLGFFHRFAELNTIQAVETVSLDYG